MGTVFLRVRSTEKITIYPTRSQADQRGIPLNLIPSEIAQDLGFCSWDKTGPDTAWALIPRGHLLLQWTPVASSIFVLPGSTQHLPGFSSTSERQIKPRWEPAKLEAKEGLLCPPWEGPSSWGLKAKAKRRLQRVVGSWIMRLDNVPTTVLSEESGQCAAHKGLLTTCR